VGEFAIQRSGEVPLNRANSWVHRWDRIPPSIKWEFLLPLFRSKINPHPAVTTRPEVPKPQLKEVAMARPYLPSFFGRGDDPFGSLFREVQKTFEDFSQRTALQQTVCCTQRDIT
jgi:hypothetical protein